MTAASAISIGNPTLIRDQVQAGFTHTCQYHPQPLLASVTVSPPGALAMTPLQIAEANREPDTTQLGPINVAGATEAAVAAVPGGALVAARYGDGWLILALAADPATATALATGFIASV